MSNPYDGGSGTPTPNNLAMASLVCGVLSLLGTGCCCIPILNYLAMALYPLTFILMIVGIVTGFMGRSQAAQTGEGGQNATIGLAASFGALALLVAIVALQFFVFGGLVVLSLLQN